jgi:hypothetical protein
VYVADGQEGLQVIDVSTPAQPRIAGFFQTSSQARDVAVSDSAVYVSLAGGEVVILRTSN